MCQIPRRERLEKWELSIMQHRFQNTVLPPAFLLFALVLVLLLPIAAATPAAPLRAAGPSKPRTARPADEHRRILTPVPGPAPRIHGPAVFGVRPGRPFLFRIPVTGTRAMTFAATGLPAGLRLDPDTGIITGHAPNKPGDYVVTFTATNSHGSNQRRLTLAVRDTLALTPPMGWNSWYILYQRVTDQDLRQAANAMIDSGMADFGYMYVNVDDCWMKKRGDPPYRDANGAILPNRKFPDMKAMADYIHSKGLRAGLYTSPGPWSCGNYVGSYQHEQTDARKFADWGFDFLKYDWCSYGKVATGKGLERLQRPYRKMARILQQLDRDIVLNLCQYGMGKVWQWGGRVGGQCWRTTGDLGVERGGRLAGFYHIGLSNAQHWRYPRPGQWNDPDYLLIGWVGDARRQSAGRPTSLTDAEQYSYMSMWSLMAAPLIFSGDMTRLDAFTLNVLCNAEVIDVDQDPLGKQARIVRQTDAVLILAKPMVDGSVAVGLFNLGEANQQITVAWSALGIDGRQIVRDLWRQRDLGTFDARYAQGVGRHGVAMLRLRPVD